MGMRFGDLVRINTYGRLKWADGKTAIIQDIHEGRGLAGGMDPLATHDIITVAIEGMDTNKPPYGLATVAEYEIETPVGNVSNENESEHTQETEKSSDPVNHPSHYTDGQYECIDFMESRGYTKDGYLFNAVKYISRAGKKDPAKYEEDISKAIWYLNRKINMAYIHPKDISTNAYIEDKGLENTLVGLALKMIEKQCYEEALMLLKIELANSHQKHSS